MPLSHCSQVEEFEVAVGGGICVAAGAEDSLVRVYPDLKKNESSARWQKAVALRSTDEVVAACDLAYCLHWAINQARLDARTQVGSVKPYVIEERRRALE